MIIEKNIKSTWISAFSNKILKVLEKMPIFVSITTYPNKCVIEYTDQGLSHTFDFNFDTSIEENIFFIRKWIILNWCPKLINRIESSRAPTSEEIQVRMTLQKENPEIDPFSKIKEVNEKELFIEKIKPSKSIVILTEEDLDGVKIIFKLNYPISKFISNYYNKWTIKDATEIFYKHAEFLYSQYSQYPGSKNGTKV